MGKPLNAIPQVLTSDKKANDVLEALKYVIDVREGRGMAGQGKMWVTFDDLWDAIKKIKITDQTETSEASKDWLFYDDFIANESIDAGAFVGVFKEEGSEARIRKACGLDDSSNDFIPCNGYLLENVSASDTARIYYNGINTAYLKIEDFSPGDILYIGSTPGEVTRMRKSGSKVQMVGMVVSSGIMFIPGDVVPDCCGVNECQEYGEKLPCDLTEREVSFSTDSSGLASMVCNGVFSTMDGAYCYVAGDLKSAGFFDVALLLFSWSAEDPDCSDVTFFIATAAESGEKYRIKVKLPIWDNIVANPYFDITQYSNEERDISIFDSSCSIAQGLAWAADITGKSMPVSSFSIYGSLAIVDTPFYTPGYTYNKSMLCFMWNNTYYAAPLNITYCY